VNSMDQPFRRHGRARRGHPVFSDGALPLLWMPAKTESPPRATRRRVCALAWGRRALPS